MASLTCIVVTPEATAVQQTADFVALPLYDGEIGIAPSHSPLIGRLGYGELRIRSGSVVTRYYVDGGFVHVVDNVVSVLTSRAIRRGTSRRGERPCAACRSPEPTGFDAGTAGEPRSRRSSSPRPVATCARRA